MDEFTKALISECFVASCSFACVADYMYALYCFLPFVTLATPTNHSVRLVKDLVMMNDYNQIKAVVSALVHDFTLAPSANSRKGGLVGLAAIAIALGRVSASK